MQIWTDEDVPFGVVINQRHVHRRHDPVSRQQHERRSDRVRSDVPNHQPVDSPRRVVRVDKVALKVLQSDDDVEIHPDRDPDPDSGEDVEHEVYHRQRRGVRRGVRRRRHRGSRSRAPRSRVDERARVNCLHFYARTGAKAFFKTGRLDR
mgnify:CR=1 FL=1